MAKFFQHRFNSWLIACAVVCLLAACVAPSPRTDAQWVDPGIHPGAAALRGAKIMIVCGTPDFALRQICQDRLTAQLRMRGNASVPVAQDFRLSQDRPLDDQIAVAAQGAGAQAVLVVTPTPVFSSAGPGLSVGTRQSISC